ncbi:SDR family oxidoreductase [Paractinoplanes lichenicola]|uniref:SDR family oxidoreductase n=1 Tax=Paractinoplanes lichenicola TaxID=2802976 RepID=A0ABS1VTZ6_9ACTN|nr:SDR family oxidoreductase [Actinoplanes lichenicola]MBL7257957.1 SDR family oxidoreductase [Actinoplanes lichenicola]
MTTTKQAALVTGANKGIGFETARQLAQQGYTVWLAARDQQRGENAAKELAADGDVRFVALDVTDDASVQAAAARVGVETGPLDVLVNNAGIGIAAEEGAPSTIRLDTIERTLAVNLYGALRVTQAFLPLVRRAAAGRIVNVSSTMGSVTTLVAPGNPLGAYGTSYAYSTSKTALNALTGALAVELAGTPIKVNSVCPGFNATDMNDHQGVKHPSEGAATVVRAATLPADGPTGTFFDDAGPVTW